MASRLSARPFTWDLATGLVALAAALMALVPLAGFLLAWQQVVPLAGFTRWAVLPALLVLGACEAWLVRRSPLLFNRLAAGLVGGLAGTLVFDAVRWLGAYAFKGAPDYVPVLGQYLTGETVGIAPTGRAVALGYGYHYLLMGALAGAAYSLALGRGRAWWGTLAGIAIGIAFVALPQARLLAVATGFDLTIASAIWLVAFGLGGSVLGVVARQLGQTATNAFRVVFLREERSEALVGEHAGRF